MGALSRDAVVGIVGAGTMGAGIAQLAATAGHRVRLFDARPEAAAKAIAGVAGRLEASVARGRRRPEEVREILGRLEAASDLAELAPAALVIEAIVEELEAKRALFAELEAILGPEAILATNTSSLSITALAAGLARPGRLAGMHFFNPAPVMPLVEIVSGLETDPDTAATLFATAAAWGKEPIRVRNTPGFVVNRVARPFYGEGFRLLAEGAADPATLDAVYRDCGGFRMGPFELVDLIGLDVNLAVTRSVFAACHYDRRYTPSPLQEEMVAAGRLGRKSGRGFYDYGEGAARPEPAAEPEGAPPAEILAEGHLGPAEPLLDLAREAGIRVQWQPHGPGLLHLGGTVLMMTDGTAAEEHAARQGRPVVTFDLCLDYRSAPRIAVAAADRCEAGDLAAAAGFFQAMGKRVTRIGDLPGMVILRTLAMLAAEAADLVHHGIAEPEAVDLAMRKGVNYPRGPLAWAREVGWSRIVECLDHLARAYGGERYRGSLWLRRRLWREAHRHG
ncbi:MAG TPA: 3-hydroxyacyl-CoA dehydrogenase [Rhodospirillales bacterium]|nr:3-hydroxyacyl-CoA dehydrogenase [Rhodospirillales bacterium]